MTIDAIILTKTDDLFHYGLTCRTINSLIASKEWEHGIIVVESKAKNTCKENGFVYNVRETIYPECQFNYNKFLNIAIEKSNSDWILICNNDLYFYKNWLIEIKKAIKDNPQVDSFSPISPTWHLHQNLTEDYYIGYEVSKNICGWCILLKREVIKKCNLFDEKFEFWYQDNDYALSIRKQNIKHALVKKSMVQHYISKSHDLLKNNEHSMTHGQQQIFINKWKKDIL
jgi:GT2 family glycosyltransferase